MSGLNLKLKTCNGTIDGLKGQLETCQKVNQNNSKVVTELHSQITTCNTNVNKLTLSNQSLQLQLNNCKQDDSDKIALENLRS